MVTAIASYHAKGGNGTTSVLSSLAVYSAFAEQRPVMALDMDLQGALYYSFTGDVVRDWDPESRHLYCERMKRGFTPASHPKIKEMSLDIRVGLYPTCMFEEDQYFRPEFLMQYRRSISEALQGNPLLVFDLFNATGSEIDVKPLYTLGDSIDRFVFVITCRPVKKEIEDARHAYLAARKMLLGRDIQPERVKGVHVLNFAQTSDDSAGLDRKIDEWIHSLRALREGSDYYLSQSAEGDTNNRLQRTMFPLVDSGLIKDFVVLPEVVNRGSADFNLYSILLEDGFALDNQRGRLGIDVNAVAPDAERLDRGWTELFSSMMADEILPHPGERTPEFQSRQQFLEGIARLHDIISP